MFKSQQTTTYSRIEQHDDEEDTPQELLQHHANSVLVANHHGECNIVPLLSQTFHNTQSPPHSPRASFSGIPDATRRFFQTKLPIAFRKDMASTASFASLPAVIIADLQNGNLPIMDDTESTIGDQGWTIVHRRPFRGKHGIGETRHPANIQSPVNNTILDEEIDPSDQVTCSVFVKYEEPQQQQVQPQYTMTMSPLYDNQKPDTDERVIAQAKNETKSKCIHLFFFKKIDIL